MPRLEDFIKYKLQPIQAAHREHDYSSLQALCRWKGRTIHYDIRPIVPTELSDKNSSVLKYALDRLEKPWSYKEACEVCKLPLSYVMYAFGYLLDRELLPHGYRKHNAIIKRKIQKHD